MNDSEYDYEEDDGPPKRRKVRKYDPKQHFLTQSLGGYLAIPKVFFQLLRLEDVVTLAYLCDRHEFHKSRDELGEGGWFYCTVKTVKDHLGFNKHRQARILRRLEHAKFIKRKKVGIKSKRWVRIRHKQIAKVAALVQKHGPKTTAAASENFYAHMRTTRDGIKNVDDCKFQSKRTRSSKSGNDGAKSRKRRKRKAHRTK